jgi:DNA (cytosine-5)-methyltransferase 1
MKYISICSGIEAATVAFHGFGWTPLAFSEIEAFPSAVLATRWPQVPNLGDMTKFAEWPEEILAECDLLVGGPPCQAFSVAGLLPVAASRSAWRSSRRRTLTARKRLRDTKRPPCRRA